MNGEDEELRGSMVSKHSLGFWHAKFQEGFPGGSEVKNPPANAGDAGLIPRLGRSPGRGNGNPLQYFLLGNSMDKGAWLDYSSLGHRRVRHDLVTKQ